MSEWIKCSDKLPMSSPELPLGQPPSPDYDWIIVCNKDGSKWAMARYAHENVNRQLIPKWQFVDSFTTTNYAAESGDMRADMHYSEIYWWFNIWAIMPENE